MTSAVAAGLAPLSCVRNGSIRWSKVSGMTTEPSLCCACYDGESESGKTNIFTFRGFLLLNVQAASARSSLPKSSLAFEKSWLVFPSKASGKLASFVNAFKSL